MNLFVNSFKYLFLDNIKKLTIFIMNCCILPCNATICFGYISMLPNSFHFRRVEGSIVFKKCQYWKDVPDNQEKLLTSLYGLSYMHKLALNYDDNLT